MNFVRSRHVVETLIANMELHCCMELLIVIGWDAGVGYLQNPDWLTDIDLVPALLAALQPDHPHLPELATHVTRALVDLVVKCPNSRPVVVFQEPPCVDLLISLVRSGHPRIVPGALTLLVVLAQRDPFLQDPAAYCAKHGAQETYLSSQITALVPTLVAIASPEEAALPDAVHDEAVLFARGDEDALPSTPRATITPYSARVAGDARLKAVELISVGIRAATTSFVDAFFAAGGFKPLFALMLRFPWNSLLHALVETCICAALQSRVARLYSQLLQDSDLVPWLLRCFRVSREYTRAGKHGRLGYMAYAVRVASIVHRAVEADEAFGAAVRQHVPAAVWAEFEAAVNEATRASTQQQLYRALRIAVKRAEVDADASHAAEADGGEPDVYSLASQLAHHDHTASLIEPALIESFPFTDTEPMVPLPAPGHEHETMRPLPMMYSGIATLLSENVQTALHALTDMHGEVTRAQVMVAVATLDASALLQLARMLPRESPARPHLEEIAAQRGPAPLAVSAAGHQAALHLAAAPAAGQAADAASPEGAASDSANGPEGSSAGRPPSARSLALPGLASTSMRRQRSAEELAAAGADSPAHYSQRMLGRVTLQNEDAIDAVRFEDSEDKHSQELQRAKALFADVRRMQDPSEEDDDDDDDDFFAILRKDAKKNTTTDKVEDDNAWTF